MCNCPECAKEIEQLHDENDKWAKFCAEQNEEIANYERRNPMQTIVENPMVLERPVRPVPIVVSRLKCDCDEDYAVLEINGRPRCEECAKDEGVKRL